MSATTSRSGKISSDATNGTSAALTSRRRFANACRCVPVDRPPVWLMRQAGRALPEYRQLKEKYSFLELVQTPELACEVTLQPIRRFGFDAAILFSDILVIPEAMGQRYRFRDTGGVEMDFAVRSKADVDRLSVDAVTERLAYVDRALRLLRRELGDRTALIGFAGSPWTLATFMMEGGSAERFTRARALFNEDRKTYCALAEKLTAAITVYLQMQAAAGVDALQIFDSHGGQLAPAEFPEASGRWIREIVSALGAQSSGSARNESEPHAPAIIVFSLGTHQNWSDLVETGANALGIDWQFPLADARKRLPDTIALQGNLAPGLLNQGTPDAVVSETNRVLSAMRGRPGHIVNRGHGVPPDSKLENIQALVNTVRGFK